MMLHFHLGLGLLAHPLLMAWVQADPQTPTDTLLEQCALGKINSSFTEACLDLLREDVLAHPVNAALPADFFAWLKENPRLRDDAQLAMSWVGPKVASNLQALRSFDEGVVKSHPALAVAYAAAWSSGAEPEPERYWNDAWQAPGRDMPAMTESLLYHVERGKEMRISLKDAPWQILAHLADSMVPIPERLWALERYRSRATEELRGRFADVPYTLDPQRGDAAYTLASYLEYGGPCTHNVQFAGGVFDAFGIPSGWAGGPGHTYPYWFESQAREVTLHRSNELGNRNGKIRDPMGPGHVWEDDLRLLVAALNRSIQGQRRAALAAWAYRRIPEQNRAAAAVILLEGIAANPLCAEALAAVADATRLHLLSAEHAGRAWETIRKALADRPVDMLPLLDLAVPPFGAGAPSFDGDLALLVALERQWKDGGQPEAIARIPFLRARCLAARGQHGTAARILLQIAKQAADADPPRFAQATAALVDVVPAGVDGERRLEVLRDLIAMAEPSPREGWTTVHRSRFHAIRRLVKELTLLQREEEAHAYWYAELAAARGADPGTGAAPLLVGGAGGGPFADAPLGAELIGLRVSTTDYAGRVVIGSVQGIYVLENDEVFGALAGVERSSVVEVRAPAGWRVIGIVAAGSDRCDGFQLVFAPRDLADSRLGMSAWIGSHADHEVLVGGRGVRVVGLRGRAGADVDAIGLIGVRER